MVLHIVAWSKTSPNTILRDAERNAIPGWDQLPSLVWKTDTWNCPDQDCNKWNSKPEKLKSHYLAVHMGEAEDGAHKEDEYGVISGSEFENEVEDVEAAEMNMESIAELLNNAPKYRTVTIRQQVIRR